MQKFLNTELGRSLVEMLGVLAIVGVLSIGAIAGYSYAITKWKASEILTDLHTRAIEYTRQMALTRVTPDFIFDNFEFGDENSLGNPVAGFPLYEDPDYFEIDVRGVSAEVCEQIIRDYATPILNVAVNGGDYGAEEEECRVEMPNDMVTMTFLFSKTLDSVMPELKTKVVLTTAGQQAVTTRSPITTTGCANGWASEENRCCDEDEKASNGHCCPSDSGTGWSSVAGACCPSGEKAVSFKDENGDSQTICCPSSASGYYAWAEGKCCASGERASNGHCCANNGGGGGWSSSDNRCCASTETLLGDHCCPLNGGDGGWGENVNRCCTTEEKSSSAYDAERNRQYYCCPSASDGWGVNVNRCCDADQGEKRYGGYDSSINRSNSFCCPENGGTGGWGRNVQRCCTAEETRVYNSYDGYYYCCPTGQTWDSTTERCVGGEANQCATNDDCLANEFCAYSKFIECEPTTGVCQPATVSHTKTINGVTYKRSSAGMYWWSAENFCARIGGSLASVSDFECGYDFVGNKNTGYCNKDTSTSSSGTRSDTMKEFMSGLGSEAVWTDDDYSACKAYDVDLYSGYVGSPSRHSSNYALCRLGG